MSHQDRGCQPGSGSLTVGEIFRYLAPTQGCLTGLNSRQKQAFRALAACRTVALGGAVWRCEACGKRVAVYHSCRDRHCPRCQAMARFRWVAARVAEVLPVPYFHTVFTLPHALNSLIRANMKVAIGCLFRAVAQTLKTFAANPKHLGAEPGLLMVLHTWGRTLNFHVHIHCIITGGGLSPDRGAWIPVPNKKYLFPVRALSLVFRGKYLAALEQCVARKALFTDATRRQSLDMRAWRRKRGHLCAQKWVVYAKPPFGGPAQVIKYLGAYTHRVAIANSRLTALQDGRVSFRYKDYKSAGAMRTMTLPAAEFAKRFLAHVLPNRLVRIRYNGFLANCKKRRSLELCRRLLGAAEVIHEDPNPPEKVRLKDESDPLLEVRQCPACGERALIPLEAVDHTAMWTARGFIYNAPRGPP